MKKNRIRLLILTICCLALLTIVIFKNRLLTLLPKKNLQNSSLFKKELINQVNIDNNGQIINIYKKNSRWFLKKNNFEYLADKERVDKIIDNYIHLNKEEPVSVNKKKHKELGIDQQRIIFKTKDQQFIIYIGNTNNTTNNYIRLDNNNEVYITSGFDSVFYPEDYRDLRVNFIDDENTIKQVKIQYNNQSIFLEKKNDQWYIEKNKVKKELVDFFLNDLKTLRANDIFDKADFSPPQALSIKTNIKERADFYAKDKENYYLKTTQSNLVYEIPAASVESLKKEEKDFIQ